jgi:ABC-2 type transport system permease protein
MFGIVFVGFGQALQALYLSDDIDKLLVAPVRTSAVMAAKLLSRMPSNIIVLFVVTIPAIIAYGIVAGLGAMYHVTAVLLVAVTPLFGISAGALVAIALVRLLPARRLNEWVGAASIVIGVLMSMLFYATSILGDREQTLDVQTLATVQAMLDRVEVLPLPSFWAGRALVELGHGQVTTFGVGAVGFYLLLTAGLFLLTVLVMNRLYLTGWLRMQSSGRVSQDVGERPGAFGRNSLDFILGYKDWLLRIRDPRLLATLATTMVMAVFMVFILFRPTGGADSLLQLAKHSRIEGAADPFSAGVTVSAMILFAGWMAFSRLALTSLSIERNAFYILKTAPVPPGQLLRAKTYGIFIPYAVLATTGLVAGLLTLKFSLLWAPYAWLVLMVIGYGLFAYLVSLGFLYPKFDWDDPRRMTNRRGSLPALFGTVFYVVLAAIVAESAYLTANAWPSFAVPIVLMGLALLGGGTWFFVQWRTGRVERAWPAIGAE